MSGARARGEPAEGVVVAFDRAEGLGRVRLASGLEVGFHATELADGSRDVAVGREVRCVVVPWHRGRLEAARVEDRRAGGTEEPGGARRAPPEGRPRDAAVEGRTRGC